VAGPAQHGGPKLGEDGTGIGSSGEAKPLRSPLAVSGVVLLVSARPSEATMAWRRLASGTAAAHLLRRGGVSSPPLAAPSRAFSAANPTREFLVSTTTLLLSSARYPLR
jgi:hypothetical protein